MGRIPAKQSLVLASSSPRRRDLLEQIGLVPDEVISADVDEAVHRGEAPSHVARRLAATKACAVAAFRADAFVIGADTVVACGRRMLPKTEDEEIARRWLRLLSGRRHRVYGGICVIAPGGEVASRVVSTVVTFKRLGDDEIDRYVGRDEWRNKAGAYAIQGQAAAFITRINGSYTNVVGLPLCETAMLLSGLGFRSS